MQVQDAYTVSSLTQYIRTLFDADLRMQDVWVQGEVSNFTAARSGHWYFTIKDADSELKCVMWRSSAARQTYTPQHGDAIVAHGHVTVYEARGQYQLYADAVQPAGRGDLHREFERLKARLEAEGLFDPERKRPLPDFPRRIGVVTSPTAAAFQDVLNVLGRRNPLADVILSPTLVQGSSAPPQIAAALDALNRIATLDVILLVRGGGSLEDLWAFNDEEVARAIAASRVPVVSGVGHEIDFTIADFAADHRAPTPSAAAEVVTPLTVDELALWVEGMRYRLADALNAQIAERRRLVEQETRMLDSASPQRRIDNARQRIDTLTARADRALESRVKLWESALDSRRRALASADPRVIMQRGYAIVESAEGQRLTRAASTRPGDALTIHLAQGRLESTVNAVHANSAHEDNTP